jgi:hypothetical protein
MSSSALRAGPYFEGKNVLLISPESWDHLFVSKHHYAVTLAQQNKVFFLNPPQSKWVASTTPIKNLTVLDYAAFPRGLRFYPRALQRLFMRKKFRALETLAATTFDCVWSFDNSVFFDFTALPRHVFSICHIVDYAQNFQFATASQTAHICFGVSSNLVQRLAAHNPNSFLIPHGTALPVEFSHLPEVSLPGRNTIKAVYAGNLNSKFLHRSLMSDLVQAFPEVDFVFLGSGGEWLQGRNVFRLGQVPHHQLGAYLQKSDILFSVYDTHRFPNQLTNAHKILDYLAAGKVIVSTPLSDYAGKTSLIVCTEPAYYISMFRDVCTSLPDVNAMDKITQRRNFAAANTYQLRLSEIDSLVVQTLQKYEAV